MYKIKKKDEGQQNFLGHMYVCAAIQSTDKCLTGIWHPTTGKGAKEETIQNTNVIDYFAKLIGAKGTKLPKAAVNAVKERGIYKDVVSDEEESQTTSESEQQGDDANDSN